MRPRLLDIVHADQKLYLVFEFLDVDLKRYMDLANKNQTPITLEMSKVCRRSLFLAVPAAVVAFSTRRLSAFDAFGACVLRSIPLTGFERCFSRVQYVVH